MSDHATLEAASVAWASRPMPTGDTMSGAVSHVAGCMCRGVNKGDVRARRLPVTRQPGLRGAMP